MANTLQSLFPFNLNNPKDFTVYPCVVEFSAPVVAGKYVFNETLTPSQIFGKLLQGQTGIIAGVMISANTSAAEFTQALKKPLFLQVLHDGNKTPVNMAPFPFADFSHGDNFQVQWENSGETTLQEEDFSLSVIGEVEQLEEMVLNELVLKVTFNFIRAASATFDPLAVGVDESGNVKTLSPAGNNSILFVKK